MPRLPLLAFLLLAACKSLSPEDHKQLASYQHNAGLYFDGGRLDQALQLVDRGLEIAPDDYKLCSMRAAILLRTSGTTVGSDQRQLDECLAEFAKVWDQRSPYRHESYVLLYYALARQKQGLRLGGDAVRLRNGAATAGAAPAVEEAAQVEFDAANEMLQVLLERGEYPRMCHYHLLQIARATGKHDEILAQGELYFKAAAKEKEALQAEVDRTMVAANETDKKLRKQTLEKEELEVRTEVGNLLFMRKDYDGALAQVDEILRIDPTRSADHYNRGRVLRELGRVDESKADLRKFLATTQLPADNPKVRDAVQALAR